MNVHILHTFVQNFSYFATSLKMFISRDKKGVNAKVTELQLVFHDIKTKKQNQNQKFNWFEQHCIF